MKNKVIIAIITALICICAIVGAVQHFSSEKEENSNLISAEISAQETSITDVSTEAESATAEETTAKAENHSQAENATHKEVAGKTAGTTAKRAETTAKQQTTTAPKTTKVQTTAKITEKQNITVTVSINCKTALKYGADVPQSGYFYSPAKRTVKNGATAFDILEKVCTDNGISLSYQSKTYIQAIGGLAEKDCGSASGWTYRVKGKNEDKFTNPPMPASKYVLSDGDTVEWYYVTSKND